MSSPAVAPCLFPLAAETREVLVARERQWASMAPAEREAWAAALRQGWATYHPATTTWFPEPVELCYRQDVPEQVLVALGIQQVLHHRTLSALVVAQRGHFAEIPLLLGQLLRFTPAVVLCFHQDALQQLAARYDFAIS